MKLPSLPPLPGDRSLAGTGQTPRRRLILFQGVWRFSSLYAIFRAICLVVLRFFVYLPTTTRKHVAIAIIVVGKVVEMDEELCNEKGDFI